MILTGTGTSHGIPVIGCGCPVCTSDDPHDKRMRCSAYICEPSHILVDVGPEFRLQALAHGIKSLDAVFVTHSHADHLHGIDDLRIFSHTKAVDPAHPDSTEIKGDGLRLYTTAAAERDIRHRFDYIFTPMKEGGGKPKIRIMSAQHFTREHPLYIGAVEMIPVMISHGSIEDMGLLFSEKKQDGKKHSIAYLTDCNEISTQAIETVRSSCGTLDHLVIDGLRKEPHSTHFSFAQALEAAEKMNPRNVCLTHITHNMSHRQICSYIQEILKGFPNLRRQSEKGCYIGPAFDGMTIEC